jgi:predicted RNA binding protein YcfA (HicA-like mRNA interferase family)
MSDYARDVKKVLHENGCYYVRPAKGDHEYWYSPITKRTFPVDHKIKSRHTANGIMKQAGIKHKF